MNYLLILLSITLETGKNIFSNSFSKTVLKNETDIYKFNFFLYLGSFVLLLFFGVSGFSLFTAVMALLFALAVELNQYFLLKALKIGPMSFTNFIQCSSLIIPTLMGPVLWQETISTLQYGMLALLIVSMALALGLKREKMNGKWLAYSFVSMAFLGAIGIIQSSHQMSAYSGELVPFLQLAFLFTMLINLAGWLLLQRKQPSTYSMGSRASVQAGASGVFMGGVHMINLYLTGAMDKIILFPLLSGGLILLSLLSAVVFFRERLTAKQWLGVVLGTVALCFISI